MGYDTAREQAREADISKRASEMRRELVTRSAFRAVPMNIINATILSIFMIGIVSPIIHGSWLAAMAIGSLVRLGTITRARRQKRLPSDNEMTLYIMASAFVGSLWGIAAFLIGPDAPGMTIQAVALVIAGMTAGSALTSAADQRVVTAYNLPAISLFALHFILIGTIHSYLMAGFVILFFFITRSISSAYSSTLLETVRTNVELEDARRETEEQTKALSSLAERHEAAARAAEESSKANAAVLANMSHQLSTPLNGILGMSQLLMESDVSDDHRHMVKRIHESGDQLSNLLRDVLDVSRIEAGRLALVMDDVTIEGLGNWVNRKFGSEAESKGIAFEVQLTGDVTRPLRGDAERIQQILGIFVGNAIRFTEEGGVTLTLCVSEDENDFASLRAEIRDTGVGVPDTAKGHLFNAFYSDYMDETIRQSGTGLGLHLAERLSSLMNGEVGYEGQETGSLFWMDLKLKCSSRSDRFADNESMDLTNRRLRVLVGESDNSRRAVLLGYLKALNCVVTCVKSQIEMVETLNSSAYDIVVLGITLDDATIEDAIADIRALPSTASMTPVVRLNPDQKEPVRELSQDIYVRMPIASEPLLEGLKLALNGDPNAISRLRKIA